ncbi:hypothetical protein HL667_02565 [Bradyrhizobium sp. 83012]|uniref:Uncharacterized protein n=1 Tax=Bradyrhizobium aeschynomenes TaxID=2734909 RepID=A0ABX2C6G8_9BRAD|nr:hypothetical protein [Bradyrhizobium aeschynomenes]NPU12901.1 hypothetical protein [Bradyrhizobium aeschynomenes]NPU63874.1 hypothetical protein [Bradyrhizobium aeschynomenes]
MDYITIIGTRDAGMDLSQEWARPAYQAIPRQIHLPKRNSVTESAVGRADRVRAGREAHA